MQLFGVILVTLIVGSVQSVTADHDEETGQDMIKVIKTSGSGYGGVYEHITTVTSDPKEM